MDGGFLDVILSDLEKSSHPLKIHHSIKCIGRIGLNQYLLDTQETKRLKYDWAFYSFLPAVEILANSTVNNFLVAGT